MDPVTGAALIGGGASLLGGWMGSKSQASTAQKNRKLQMYMAKHGVSLRVADAKKAGISPLAALGANIHQPTPEHIGSDPMAEAVANTGQNISRAIMKKQELENELIKANIYKTRAEASQIGALSGNRTNMPDYEGKGPGYSTLHSPDGTRIPVMSDYAAQRLEEDLIAKTQAGAARMNPLNEEIMVKRMKLTDKERKQGYRGFTWTPMGYKPIKSTKDKSVFYKYGKVKKYYKKKLKNFRKKVKKAGFPKFKTPFQFN